MTDHLRSNFVAYLALFVALSGSAYAANRIGTRDIKKGAVKSKQIGDGQVRSRDIKKGAVRSKQIGDGQVRSRDINDGNGVKSVDVLDGSLSGDDINESTLGQVPLAASADSAKSLEGFDASQLLASDRILYGRASVATDKALLFDWPGTGVEVRTADTGAGDSIFQVRILNLNPTGGSRFTIVRIGSSAASLLPGDSKVQGGLTGTDVVIVENKGTLGRMLHLTCFANVISAGDDNLMQCMGITAGDS